MQLEIKYEKPSHNWCVLHVFDEFYKYIKDKADHEYINSASFKNRFAGGINSAQVMILKNKQNGKYILVSYWDNCKDLVLDSNGWDRKKCVDIITSSGIDESIKTTPFTYLPYSKEFEIFSKNAKSIDQKENNRLFFKGFLYGERMMLKDTNLIDISNEKTTPHSCYFEELTNNKICLSLNGAGEICNRDIEILSAKSVLFRPKLKTKFHNELTENVHYVPFDCHSDPKKQCEIILNKFQEIKDNLPLLKEISENGYNWYLKNATIESNVEILKKLINLDRLK